MKASKRDLHELERDILLRCSPVLESWYGTYCHINSDRKHFVGSFISDNGRYHCEGTIPGTPSVTSRVLIFAWSVTEAAVKGPGVFNIYTRPSDLWLFRSYFIDVLCFSINQKKVATESSIIIFIAFLQKNNKTTILLQRFILI